ncbi:hypothetical protein, partial [Stenotrophomonas maltophilia]|uniref:hypothetical protein n=2 Tax=Gammaproteobacteria TaxID=1236 RepID=UPI001954AE3D
HGVETVQGVDIWDQFQFLGFGYSNSANAISHMAQVGRDVVFADQGVTISFHDVSLNKVAQAGYLFV